MTTLKTTLSRLMLAGALVAGVTVAAPSWDAPAPTANNFSQQEVRRLSSPLSDYGDPDIRDMPVVR